MQRISSTQRTLTVANTAAQSDETARQIQGAPSDPTRLKRSAFPGSAHRLKGLLLASAPLLLLGSVALGGDGISVNITNDGTDDILVTVYDNAIGRHAVVLAHARINGFTSVPVSMSPDASGQANLSWTAVSTDSKDRKCGHEDNLQLSDSSSVAVHADSTCSTSST